MKFKTTTALLALAFVASVSAHSERTRDLHMTKECSEWKGAAGDHCTITSSNIAGIKVGSRVYYVQAAGILEGVMDSNIVLDAGKGNRAVGRCTLDQKTGLGLCTFSDGTGRLAGFNARIQVSPPTDSENKHWHWDGTFSFSPRD